MKGIVFFKFNKMVKEKFGAEMLNNVIENSNLESAGIYTVDGYYNHAEIVELVSILSRLSGTDIKTLLYQFGVFLFRELIKLPSPAATQFKDSFTLIANVDSVIHPEVQKLYPDATLPRFDTLYHDDKTLKVLYRSPRHFDDLAHGLIRGCIDYFEEDAHIAIEPLNDGILFSLTK